MNTFLLICLAWFIFWYISCYLEYNEMNKIDTSSLFRLIIVWPVFILFWILIYTGEFFYVYFPKISPYLNPKKYLIMSFEFLNSLFGKL